MCVYICVRAELCTCMRVCVRARTCVNAHACTFSHVRMLLCVHLCTQVCVYVCVRVQGCVNADVRACGGGCMHICVKSVRVSFMILHHLPASSPPWKPPVGLACTANQTLELLVLLLLNPLLSNHWLLLDHHGFTSTRDSCPIPQKQLLKFARMQGFGFLWSRRPVEGRFRPLIQAVYIRIIRRIYTPGKIHIRSVYTNSPYPYTQISKKFVKSGFNRFGWAHFGPE